MTPKKILLMAHDVTLAHLGRPLHLAELLVADGHDVVLATSQESSRFLASFKGRTHTLEPTGKERFIYNLAKGKPVFDFETLLRYRVEVEAVLCSYRPDIVIGDFSISLSVSALRHKIPYATITNAYWSPAFTPRFIVPDLPMVPYLGVSLSQFLFDLVRPLAFTYHARPMNALRRHYGLPSLGNDLRRVYTDADLDLFSDIPETYGLTGDIPGGSFLGPINWSPNIPLPNWWDALDPNLAVVYVTLGSSGDGRLLPEVIRQLTSLGVQLVVATAGARGLPEHPLVFSSDYLPGDQVAARSSLVICNGGSPTSAQALAKGVPVLGIPGNLDQYLNMHYLEKRGLAQSLRNQNIGNGQLPVLAKAMMADKRLRERTERHAEIMSGYDNRLRLADAISRLDLAN